MNVERLFDQTLSMLQGSELATALPLLAGNLYGVRSEPARWDATVAALRSHPLHYHLLQDPYTRRGLEKPRGYAGDAVLIDYIYDQRPPEGLEPSAQHLFTSTTDFPVCRAVRERRDYAAGRLAQATSDGLEVLVLACGHLREAVGLSPEQASLITAVDQDPLSLAEVRRTQPSTLRTVEANAFNFLRDAAKSEKRWNLIYTLGLTDYFDERAMDLFHRLMRNCLAPNGTILLANFQPDHLAIGWMEAIMDWHLIYRDQNALRIHADRAELTAQTWSDRTGTIAWCEMEVA